MESWLDLESDGELEEHVEGSQFGAEGSQDPHAVSPFEDQEKSEDNVASEPCKAEGAGSREADREVNAEELPAEVATAKAETAESQEDVEEAPVNAENDKEMSEDSFVASEPKDAQLAEAPRDDEPQLAELAAVEDVESREVQVRVEEVDYEESNSDGELLEEDAKSVATEAESEEAASATSAAEDVEDANTSDQNSDESGRSIKSTERRRHKRRRRSSHHGHHGHRRRRRRHNSGHERSRRRNSQGRRKRMKTEKDHGPGGGPAAKQPQQSTLAPRGQREVYVGGLCWKDADKEGIAETFNSAFEALPDYQKRYSHETRKPVLQVHYPKDIIRKAAVGMRGDFAVFVFVEFVDEVLARTALKLTGLRIAQRSVRVCSTVGIELEGETLDVEPLRQWEKLPLRPRDGTTMLLNVWLGGLPMRLCREELQRQRSGTELSNDETLESRICTAVLALPGVKLRYPQMEKPIVALRVSECQRYLFVEAATELIASSMVAARGLSLPGGLEATTGWPVAVIDADERAPPPLAEDGSLCDPSQVAALVQKAVVCEEDFAERLDCEIFMGGTNCLEVEDLWKALTELLMDLPDYKKQFPDLSLPVINLRTAHAPYAFARLAHPRLASTAVAIGEMFVRSRKVQLKRPTHCELQTFAPPLDVIRPSLLPPPPPRTPPRTPQRDRRGGTGPEFPALPKAPPRATEPGAAAGTAPPTPPKVPLNRRPQGTIQRIWIGNLPGREKMLEMIDPEEDEKQENKGDGIEMMKRLVDRRVNELAMEMPNYDVEDGPLTKRVTVHPTGRYAFIRVVGDQDFVEELLDVLDGKDFMGKPLRVNWAREKEDFWWQKKLRGTKPGVPRYVLQLPKGLQQLIAPETEKLRTEEVVTNAPPKVLEIDEL